MMLPVAVLRRRAAAPVRAGAAAGAGGGDQHAVLARLAAGDAGKRRAAGSVTRKPVTALVLPMAVTLFRLTSPVQYMTSAASSPGPTASTCRPAQLVAGAALAVVISLGSVGLPGQVTFIATNLPVAQAMGLPVGAARPDAGGRHDSRRLATLGNVTADVTATSVVARQSRADTA